MERVFHGIPTNVYVDVEVMSDKNGNTLPLSIIWGRGERYTIDKIYDVCRALLAQGGEALCYECKIKGKRRELYLQNGKWFVIIDKEME